MSSINSSRPNDKVMIHDDIPCSSFIPYMYVSMDLWQLCIASFPPARHSLKLRSRPRLVLVAFQNPDRHSGTCDIRPNKPCSVRYRQIFYPLVLPLQTDMDIGVWKEVFKQGCSSFSKGDFARAVEIFSEVRGHARLNLDRPALSASVELTFQLAGIGHAH